MNRLLARRIIHLGWPVLVAQLATMANSVIDTVMAGHYSARALATVGLGSSIYFSIFIALMGILIALSPITAQHFGAGRHDAITHDVRQGLWMALMLSAAAVVLLGFPDPFLTLSGMRPEIAQDVRAYLHALMWAAPAMLAFRVFASFATAVSQPRAVMVIQLLGLVLKIPLNWILMYGKFGVPELGGIGCAWALAIEAWLMLGAALVWLRVGPGLGRYQVFARIDAIDWRAQWEIVKLGLPIGMSFLIDVTSYTFMALFIARLGEAHSAAQQIAANIGALAYMVPLAIANAAAVVTGQLIGAGEAARARAAGWTGIGLCAIAALATGLGIFLLHGPLTRAYTGDPQVALLAAPLAMLVAAFHVFDAINAVAANVVRAYKKALVPMLSFALALWIVGLGGGYLLAFGPPSSAPPVQTFWAALPGTSGLAPLGAAGFWIGAIAGMALAAGIGVAYFGRVSRAALRR